MDWNSFINIDGVKEGLGIVVLEDKSVYEGELKNDQFSGQGRYACSNGEIYEGSWREGKAQGEGVYIYRDKSTFEGEWKNNKSNGKEKKHLKINRNI